MSKSYLIKVACLYLFQCDDQHFKFEKLSPLSLFHCSCLVLYYISLISGKMFIAGNP